MSLVGNLEDLGLGEILQIVSLSRKSGVLALHSREREGRIEFRFGQVTRARSTTFQQGLGEVLLQRGIIDAEQLTQALDAQSREGYRDRLGVIISRLFAIPEATIEDVVREQIEQIVYSLFTWNEGAFEFELVESLEADDLAADTQQFSLEQGINPQFLAMEGSRIVDEQRHRGGAEPADAVESLDMAFDQLQAPSSAAAPLVVPLAEPEPLMGELVEEGPLLVLVDDDPGTREALEQLFQAKGYRVFVFEKSEQTLIMIDTLVRDGGRPTVLIDLIMPRMDGSGILGGIELLELVRNNFPQVPVMMLADFPNMEAERKVRGMGVPFMMKPRKVEVKDQEILEKFASNLSQKLARLERGEVTASAAEKVNVDIAEELRQEMGDDHFQPSSASTTPSTGISLLRGMLEELNNPALGGGIILLVLRFASEFMNRAVIFIVKRDEIIGLGQFGIDSAGGVDDARIRSMRIPRSEQTFFTKVIDNQQAMNVAPTETTWNRYLFDQLGGSTPVEVFLGPIVSEGKVVAVLYGDNLPENTTIEDTDALEIFLSQAGIAMEKVLLQRRLQEKRQEGP
ncbi:MAG TPA: response regulator [Geobacterales bacterium]|jgi:FixJ family two-component response regulator|nr:response regulator [Geobacterales bacterium]